MIDLTSDFKIIEFRTKETAAKKLMGELKLENVNSKELINGVIWQEDLEKTSKKSLKTGNIIYIEDSKYNEQYKNCTIKKIRVVKEAKAGLDKEQREFLYNFIIEIINSLSDLDLKNAIIKLISENKELFKITPAAKNNHHNYVGGLMQHICECIQIANANFPVFVQPVDQELIIAACITHDIGKIFEYKIDEETGIAEIDEEFRKKWISHIHYGFSWANYNGFYQLARIIAAHHGRKDWGALIDLAERDIEPALYLMHHIDDISAKYGAIKVENTEKKQGCIEGFQLLP
jgi:putative nucleotidyltransferase with HDIG domain